MLDLVVFYPLQACGTKTYTHRSHERIKYQRYQPTRDGRRQLAKPLIPVVVSVFGVLNETAAAYLRKVEDSARTRTEPLAMESTVSTHNRARGSLQVLR